MPASFSEIKNLFWDFDNESNVGMGCAKNIDKAELIAELKKKHGILVSDTNTLCEHLFGGVNKLTSRRYCLVPLIDGGTKQSIECLKSLIHLAFDLTASNKDTLPKVLASVIEMGKDREQSQVKVNLQKSIHDFNELKNRQELLNKIQSNRHLWNQTDGAVKEYKSKLAQGAERYFSINSQIKKSLNDLEPELNSLLEKYKELEPIVLSGKQQIRSMRNELAELNGSYKQKKKDLLPLKKNVELLNDILGSWGSDWDEELAIKDCEKDVEKFSKIITAFDDSASATASLQKAIFDKNTLSKELDTISESINNSSKLLVSSLSEHAASVISSLNSEFAKLSVEIKEEQKRTIENFAQLFSVRKNKVDFLNSEVFGLTYKNFNLTELIESLKLQKSSKEKELDNIEDTIVNINSITKGAPKGTRAEAVEKLNEARHELYLIKQSEFLPNEFKRVQEELKSIDEKIKCNSKKLEEFEEIYGVNKSEFDGIKERIDLLKPKRVELENYEKRLSSASTEHAQRFELLKNKFSESSEFELSDMFIDETIDFISSIKTYYQDSISPLKQLLSLRLIPELDDLRHKVQYEGHEIDKALIEFDTLFNTVYQKQEQLSKEIHTHNSNVNAEIEEIRDGSRLIDTKVREINSIFKGRAISNLESIEMIVEKNAQFDELINHLDRNHVHGNELLDDEFYERLNYFCQSYFTSKSGITSINMRSLISGVKYQYRKVGSSQVTSKPQSGGTTAATNCILLAVLMNDLVSDSVKLNLPLVLDEIGNLDENNIPEVKKVADQFGFKVFAATPDLNPSALDSLNNFVTLGEFVCEDALEEEAITVCYDRDEFFGNLKNSLSEHLVVDEATL